MTYKLFLITILCSINLLSTKAQTNIVTLSGIVKDKSTNTVMPYVTVAVKTEKDSVLVVGTITNEEGRFTITNIKQGVYYIETSFIGYTSQKQSLYVGSLSSYLDAGTILLSEDGKTLSEIDVSAKQEEVNAKMDKKSFNVADNATQTGGSVLQTMQNLPGVTIQDGKIMLRGNDKVTVLMDGKQTALTGFGSQSGLDNIPASAIEKIEIINNPSAKFDANGNAGIINIIYKKNKQEGFNGKVGMAGGLGALWVKKENLPSISPQYQYTPKLNPSLSLNYRKNKINLFFQGDYLYTQTLNKNEFVTRTYDDETMINQQTKRNRTTNLGTAKAGFDWNINDHNIFTFSGLFSSEKILDRGDEPFFNNDLSQRSRLWQFLEDELKTTVTTSAAYEHKFKEAGRKLLVGANYTFHREDEKYFFKNMMPSFTGLDSFKLLSDENVIDINVDYVQPLKYGKLETGLKFRRRFIPTNMRFIPGQNSPLDVNAGGWAIYEETIPALYGNYSFENKKIELEAGLRVEYVDVQYKVNPNHNTYKSDGYHYTQPFPNVRVAYKLNDRNKLSVFYNRRVDRPNEVDIRIFPKYDDAEIIKIGNPALRPQFTNLFEIGYKSSYNKGYFYAAIYHKMADATITRIASTDSSKLIYSIMQNANRSYNTGLEMIFSQELSKWFSFNLNVNAYNNIIDAFTVINKYPTTNTFTSVRQELFSGNAKLNTIFKFKNGINAQLTGIYLAPDIIPQGQIGQRFSLDIGIKKSIQKNKGEIFINASDLLNTMKIKKSVQGLGFNYVSSDYYETQVIRIGYSYKF